VPVTLASFDSGVTPFLSSRLLWARTGRRLWRRVLSPPSRLPSLTACQGLVRTCLLTIGRERARPQYKGSSSGNRRLLGAPRPRQSRIAVHDRPQWAVRLAGGGGGRWRCINRIGCRNAAGDRELSCDHIADPQGPDLRRTDGLADALPAPDHPNSPLSRVDDAAEGGVHRRRGCCAR
jgi:hypothetical protein